MRKHFFLLLQVKYAYNKNGEIMYINICFEGGGIKGLSYIGAIKYLEERGYNPTKQIVAYLVSGDPGYISSYKECRNRILKFNREDILEVMLVDFIK